jgi:hypothetical protein
MSKTLKPLADNAYWREQDAREALDELARSGLPLEVFAKRNGLGVPRLRRWQARLAATRSSTNGSSGEHSNFLDGLVSASRR